MADENDHWSEADFQAVALEDRPITFASLDEMSEEELQDVADYCNEATLQPDDCVSCRAMVLLAVRSQEDDGPDMPRLEETLNTPPPWKHPWEDVPAPTREASDSVVKRDELLDQVDALRNSILALFDPAQAGNDFNLTPDDVALLVISAKYYVEQSDHLAASGFLQDEGQRAIIERARGIVKRVTPDA